MAAGGFEPANDCRVRRHHSCRTATRSWISYRPLRHMGSGWPSRLPKRNCAPVLHNACPGEGACGGMYTANTMASAIEALGMSLPYSSSYPADSKEKREECRAAGKALVNLLERDIKPLDILTEEVFENAITVVVALGGSTNAVLHMIAMAKAADSKLTIDDFQRISNRTPLLAGMSQWSRPWKTLGA